MTCPGYYLECQCHECIARETPSRAKDAQIHARNTWLDAADAQIAKLEAEAARYKAALEGILSLNGGHRSETNHLLNEAWDIARNALEKP